MASNYRTLFFFFFSSRRRHTRSKRDWSSDVCSSDLQAGAFGEALDHGAKAHRASCVPHAPAPLIRIEKPAEAVGNGLAGMQIVIVWVRRPDGFRAVVEAHGRQCRLKFFFAQQSVIAESVVPLGEIFETRIDATVAQRGGRRTLIGFFEVVVFFGVAEGAI